MSRSLLILASAAVGLGSGLALRHWRRPAPSAETSSGRDFAATVTLPKLIARHPSALADRLEADLSLSTGVTRWLLWMTAVEKASLSDYPRLALLAKDLPGALRMLGAQWVKLDPRHMFDSVLELADSDALGQARHQLSDVLLSEWPKSDPEAVLNAFGGRGVPSAWRMTALNTLFEADPERAIRAMSAWNVSNYSPSMKGVAAWAARDPRHAAEVAIAHQAGYGSRTLIEKIGAEWSKSDPEAALAYALDTRHPLAHSLAEHVVRSWADRDIVKASEWLAGSDGPTRDRLLPAFAEAWGKKDAAAALEWCRQNASPGIQAEIVSSLVRGTARKDLAEAAALVSQLEPSAARTRAAVAVADAAREKSWFPGYMTSRPGETVKPEALAWLDGLDSESRREALSQVYWAWVEADPRGLAGYLDTPTGQDAPDRAFVSTAQNLARLNPKEALDWAGQLRDSAKNEALSTTFGAWLGSQPKTAMDWLRSLDSADSRRAALFAGAVSHAIPWSAQHNHPDARDVLAEALSKGDPTAARGAIDRLGLTGDEQLRALQVLGVAEKGR